MGTPGLTLNIKQILTNNYALHLLENVCVHRSHEEITELNDHAGKQRYSWIRVVLRRKSKKVHELSNF